MKDNNLPDTIEMLYIESSAIGLVEFRNRVEKLIKEERKKAYSVGFEVAKKNYTYKMITKGTLPKVYENIATTYYQLTGYKDIFYDYLKDEINVYELTSSERTKE